MLGSFSAMVLWNKSGYVENLESGKEYLQESQKQYKEKVVPGISSATIV